MADVHDIKTRSYNMSQIRSKDTKPEILVRKFLHLNGYRYRLHDKNLPGKPDVVLKKYKSIIDIRGCFWHLHKNCKYGSEVSTPSEQITDRRKTAVKRDKINEDKWKSLGWRVITIWAECELEPKKKTSAIRKKNLNKILTILESVHTSN